MNNRPERRSWLALVPVAAVLLLVAFVIANGGSDLRQQANTPSISASPAATATRAGQTTAPLAPLSARYAVVSGSMTFTRESDGVSVGRVNAPLGLFAVSPDGTRVAYFPGPGFDELWIADVAHLDRAQRVLSIAPRFSGGVVWSTDGKGIVFSTGTRERVPGPGGPPIESTLEGLHLEGNSREFFLRRPNTSVRPLVWVREPTIVAAVAAFGQKGPGEYITMSEGVAKISNLPDAERASVNVTWPVASSDGRWVAALYRYGSRALIRVWPSEDLSRASDLETPGIEIRSALWRPGTLDIAVEAGGALELWNRQGGKRRVTDLGGRSLMAFRWDGSAVYASTIGGLAEVIEIDTARRARLPEVPLMGATSSSIVASARLE